MSGIEIAGAISALMYTYQSIKTLQNEIRIIKLLPGLRGDVIATSLETVNLEDKIEYEALSWSWGSEELMEQILCDGKRLSIRKNLATALKTLRTQRSERCLWIDAICIDQQNPEERHQQVLQMDKIYKRASRVIVWPQLDDLSSETEVFAPESTTLPVNGEAARIYQINSRSQFGPKANTIRGNRVLVLKTFENKREKPFVEESQAFGRLEGAHLWDNFKGQRFTTMAARSKHESAQILLSFQPTSQGGGEHLQSDGQGETKRDFWREYLSGWTGTDPDGFPKLGKVLNASSAIAMGVSFECLNSQMNLSSTSTTVNALNGMVLSKVPYFLRDYLQQAPNYAVFGVFVTASAIFTGTTYLWAKLFESDAADFHNLRKMSVVANAIYSRYIIRAYIASVTTCISLVAWAICGVRLEELCLVLFPLCVSFGLLIASMLKGRKTIRNVESEKTALAYDV